MKDMTLQEFLEINGVNRTKGYGYRKIKVYDRQNNPLKDWTKNDPKYQASVVRIHPVSRTMVEVNIKYKGE